MLRTTILIPLSAILLNAQSVPAPFQQIYNSLSSQVSTFDATVKSGSHGSTYPFLPAPQILKANSDLYTQLLTPGYYEQNITPELNSFQALASKAITVHINYPILYQPFYAYISNPSLYQEFVNFYQQLATDVHARGMKLIVECTTGTNVEGSNLSDFQQYYKSVNWSSYMSGRAQNALNVAELIGPDYMTVITEPDTEARDTGMAQVGTLSGATQLLQTILGTVQSAGVRNVLVGAGSGTWIANYTSWVSAFLALPINFLDMHIIPGVHNDLTLAITAAQMAHAAGKPVGVSECWLLKTITSTTGQTPTSLDGLNPFSFWAPLDTAFLQALVDFANADQLAYLAPSWSDYFFAYLDYGTYGPFPASTVLDDEYSATSTAIHNGSFTSTGLAWERAVLPAPDTSAPATPAPPVAAQVGTSGTQITWSADTDNVGVAGYRVYRNGSAIASVNGTAYADQNLPPNASYSYTIRAFDAAGNSSASSATLSVKLHSSAVQPRK